MLKAFASSVVGYPAVSQLVSLAATVKGIMGGSTQITPATDWSEYHSTNGWFHLDPVWASPHIDFVGIDMGLKPRCNNALQKQRLIHRIKL